MGIPDFEDLWNRLEGATTGRSPFNFLQLATVGLNGAPELRTIVLRRVDRTAGSLTFVTDLRSPKVAEIRAEPRVSLVGYNAADNTQLRLSGTARIVTGEPERRAMWQALRGRTLVLFEAVLAPGTVLDTLDAPPDDGPFQASADEAYARFARVDVDLHRFEWLDLAASPHLRCRYVRQADDWSASRLAP